MKKLKQIMKYSLLVFIFIFGINNVNAISYTNYNEGDKITVKVNDTTKYDFYVIEDGKETVKAILKGSLGEKIKWPEEMVTSTCTFDDSTVDLALNERTSNWTNVTNINLPTANDIVGSDFDYTSNEALEELGAQTNPEGFGMVHLENLNNVPFYALEENPGTRYFTNSVMTYTSSSKTHCEIYVYGYANTEFPYLYLSTYNEGSIRPIITVSKGYVVGGTYKSEYETLWESFVEKFKTTDLVESLKEAETNTIDVTSTENTLKIYLSDGTNNWTTNFTYDEGIVTYVPSDNEDNVIADSVWITNCVHALADLKGYDIKKLSDWLSKEEKYTLEKDGIEFEMKEFNQESSSSGIDVSISGEAFSSFKLDIKNGIKELNKTTSNIDKDLIQNPDTGILSYSIVVVVILITGIIIFTKTRKEREY